MVGEVGRAGLVIGIFRNMSILKYLGLEKPQGAAAETETVRKIAAELDRLEPESARYIAAFAYILSRVARADLVISAEETRVMERIVMERSGLPEPQAVLVVQIAKTQTALLGGTENYLVTREFGRSASAEQKLQLIDCLFAVCAADDNISAVEDNEIRQVADELRIERPDLIAIRSRYRQFLGVLKKPETGG